MKTFISVAQMKLSKLTAGQQVSTKGYYTAGDGGGALYLIVAPQAADEYGDHTLANSNVAVLQDAASSENYGAVADGVTDDTAKLSALDAANTDYIISNGSLSCTDITLTGNITFKNGGKLKPASAQTVIIQGNIINPNDQHIFDISASGIFEGDANTPFKEVAITWFGATDITGDSFEAAQASVDFLESMFAADSVAIQNTFNSAVVKYPAGRWLQSGLVNIGIGGIVITGESKGATKVQLTTTSGGFRFRHTDHLTGQNINNNGLLNMEIIGTASSTTASDVGLTATICRFFEFNNVRFTNLSVCADLIACEEPVGLSNLTFWHDNASLTNTSSLRILSLAVTAGTANAAIDPDTAVEYYKNSLIMLGENCEFRARAGVCLQHILINGVDGFTMSPTAHLLGGVSQIVFDPVSSAVPIANVVLDGFLDGEPSNTTRNIWVKPKTFTTGMGAFDITVKCSKVNGGDTSNVTLDHEDLDSFIYNVERTDKGLGAYMIDVQKGRGTLRINTRWVLTNGKPTLGILNLDARDALGFFNLVDVTGIVDHDSTTVALAARHIHIQTDTTNNEPQIIIHELPYVSNNGLAQGVVDIDNTSAPLAFVPIQRNLTAITV